MTESKFIADYIAERAQAAANLIANELDPNVNSKLKQICSGNPHGILSVHILSLSNFAKLFFYATSLSSSNKISVFLRISLNGLLYNSEIIKIDKINANNPNRTTNTRKMKPSIDGSKKTKELNPSSGKKEDLLEASFDSDAESQDTASEQLDDDDDFFPVPSSGQKNDSQKVDMLKNFPVVLDTKNSGNHLIFELFEAETQNNASASSLINLGQADIHLYDFIKNLEGSKTITLKLNGKRIVDVQMEFVFRYGAFGYGNSHQLGQNLYKPTKAVEHSLFFNLKSKVEKNKIEEENKANLLTKNRNAINKLTNLSANSTNIGDNKNLLNVTDLINKRERLASMKKMYSNLHSTQDKLRFLENIVLKREENKESNESAKETLMKGLNDLNKKNTPALIQLAKGITKREHNIQMRPEIENELNTVNEDVPTIEVNQFRKAKTSALTTVLKSIRQFKTLNINEHSTKASSSRDNYQTKK